MKNMTFYNADLIQCACDAVMMRRFWSILLDSALTKGTLAEFAICCSSISFVSSFVLTANVMKITGAVF